MAGRSLRRARSPVPPKITIRAGSTTRYSWSPSLRGFASSSAALTMAGGPDRVAAELLAHHRHHAVGEGVGVAAPEALEERVGDDAGGDALLDGGLDGPAALPGVLYVGGQGGEVGGLLEAERAQLQEPGADHRPVAPGLGDGLQVHAREGLRLLQDLEPFAVGLH